MNKQLLTGAFSTLLLLGSGIAMGQSAAAENKCVSDEYKTNKLFVSTGIGSDGISDTVLMNCGYGYNTVYTTPNDNHDTLWTVYRLASNYNPRVVTSGFAYTGPYLTVGQHPFIPCVRATPEAPYSGIFEAGGACVDAGSSTGTLASHFLSIYGDGGGQNAGLENSVGDAYAYQRCFYICNEDSLTFDLKILADDVIDTVEVDGTKLYVTTTPTGSNAYCGTMVSINTRLKMTAGRHKLRVWCRDNMGGHITMNVYGAITAKSGKNIVRSRYDSRCDIDPTLAVNSWSKQEQELSISPNPSNGEFSVNFGSRVDKGRIDIYDMGGKLIEGRDVSVNAADHSFRITIPGIYFVRYTGNTGVAVRKVVIR